MSALGTPKISPVRVSCRANLLASADLAVCRDNDVHRSGEVGRFLDIAPLLLHAGCSLQQATGEAHTLSWANEAGEGPKHSSAGQATLDWWAALIDTELARPAIRADSSNMA